MFAAVMPVFFCRGHTQAAVLKLAVDEEKSHVGCSSKSYVDFTRTNVNNMLVCVTLNKMLLFVFFI